MILFGTLQLQAVNGRPKKTIHVISWKVQNNPPPPPPPPKKKKKKKKTLSKQTLNNCVGNLS